MSNKCDWQTFAVGDERKFFEVLAARPKFVWRSIGSIAKNANLTPERTREIIEKYSKVDMVVSNPNNDNFYAYWENVSFAQPSPTKQMFDVDEFEREAELNKIDFLIVEQIRRAIDDTRQNISEIKSPDFTIKIGFFTTNLRRRIFDSQEDRVRGGIKNTIANWIREVLCNPSVWINVGTLSPKASIPPHRIGNEIFDIHRVLKWLKLVMENTQEDGDYELLKMEEALEMASASIRRMEEINNSAFYVTSSLRKIAEEATGEKTWQTVPKD